MLRLLAAALVVASLAVAAAPARAADPTAQAFVDTVALGALGFDALRPQIRENLAALDLGRCFRASGRDVPDRAQEHMVLVPIGAMLHATYAPVMPSLQAIVAGMDAIPTSDPALRAGRTSWRVTVQLLGSLKPFDQPCRRLEAWAKGGFKRSEARRLYPPGFLTTMQRLESRELERKMKRGERRLRQLGMTRAQVEVWTGETAFKGIEDEIDRAFEDLLGDLDEPGTTPFAAGPLGPGA